ncbi:MAG: hypothetical protein FJY07_11320, partial [Bacteroidetes bacterium]|nr:hypothetical protein [Bacteroidota bacterium]
MSLKVKINAKLFVLVIFFVYSTEFFAQNQDEQDFNCFSVLVGKKATTDGSVMFAHNEDDYGDQLVNGYKVPSLSHTNGEMISMKNGGWMTQASQTWSYLWLEMPGMEFSDSYMNEWGVTIGSDQCISREKNPELTHGGIGYELREAMASRARTAREAVKIGGALIDQYGYASSGRTYCIADPHEAWMLSVVAGKHWVAERIPDDEVAIIPNYYTITTVTLSDTMNFYGSSDLVIYAEKNLWYNPDRDGVFNFRLAYGDPENIANMGNLIRHWSAINLIAEKQYGIHDEFPFSFKPGQWITLELLFSVLRNHNEGSEFDESKGYMLGDPHGHVRAICSPATQYGFVAQLRSDLPKEIAYVLWLAPFRPCVQPFIPWYFAIAEIPEGFATGDYQTARMNKFLELENIREFAQGHKFLEYVDYAVQVDKNYGNEIESIREQIKVL